MSNQQQESVRRALEAGDLRRAAALEARAADNDGYDTTAKLLREIAAALAAAETALARIDSACEALSDEDATFIRAALDAAAEEGT